jgi:hypothetical protein
MSEADIPGYETGLPEVNVADSSHATEVSSEGVPAQPTIEDGWQTVPFPNVMPADHFNTSGNQAVTRDVIIPVASPDLVNLVQELQQHNDALHNRITQLENAIITGQQALHAEAERSQQQETLLTQRNQELAAAQERIDRLFQELGSSHQSTQRQQILIETLTAQLESSQERIAQLERECALTQQRHHDQVQLLLHAEDACRDLRARLHRQQRYTLQFKAALEKCLEVSGAAPNYFNSPEVLAESLAGTSTNKRNFKSIAIQSFTPKTQPVQPWSVQNKLLLQLPNFVQSTNDPAASLSLETEPASQSTEPPHQREWQILQSLRTAAPSEAILTSNLVHDWAVPTEPPAVEAVETFETPEPASELPFEDDFEDDAVTIESPTTTSDELVVAPLDEPTSDSQPDPGTTLTDIAFLNEMLEQQALLESLPLFAPELERQIDRIVQSFMAEPSTNDDSLWEDLARLIGVPAETESSPTASFATEESALEAAPIEIPDNIAAVNDVSPIEEYVAAMPENVSPIEEYVAEIPEMAAIATDADANAVEAEPERQPTADEAEVSAEPEYETGQVINLFQNLLTGRKSGILPHSSQTENRKTPQPSSRFLTVAATLATAPPIEAEPITDPTPHEPQNRTDLQDPLFQSSAGPSPIVYPLRPSKKLKSLAAVQLPSFPRLG